MTAAEDSYLNNIGGEYADMDEKTEIGWETPFLATDDIDKPDEFLKGQPRSRNAVAYEKKIKRILVSTMRYTIRNPKTLPDAAAIIRHGSEVSRAGGDLAAKDKHVASAIDFLSEGAGNPYLEFVAAFGILAMQIVRNHEPVAETEPKRRLRIPFTKRYIGLRFRIRLGRLREMTEEPRVFTAHVLSDPDTQKMLEKYHGIRIQENADGKA